MGIKERIYFIESLQNELISALKKATNELQKEQYIYASSNRAKFKRLRVELTKQLFEAEKLIYKR